jgi:streptogramin lyase
MPMRYHRNPSNLRQALDGKPPIRLDLSTGVATPFSSLPTGVGDQFPVAAAPDGTVYIGGSTVTGTVTRLDPDNTATVVAGTGTADPATGRQ